LRDYETAADTTKPQCGRGKVHTTFVTPGELEWFTTFNLPFGERRCKETSTNEEWKKDAN